MSKMYVYQPIME